MPCRTRKYLDRGTGVDSEAHAEAATAGCHGDFKFKLRFNLRFNQYRRRKEKKDRRRWRIDIRLSDAGLVVRTGAVVVVLARAGRVARSSVV